MLPDVQSCPKTMLKVVLLKVAKGEIYYVGGKNFFWTLLKLIKTSNEMSTLPGYSQAIFNKQGDSE